jgi:hypothetical protein
MIVIASFWLIGAILIGFFGRHLRFGFWGYFFASILFTPALALLMLLAAVPLRQPRGAHRR